MHPFFLIATLVLAGVGLAFPAIAQHTPIGRPVPTAGASSTLTNADVLGMTAAGLDDSIIIDKIHNSPVRSFDTSVEGLKALRAGDVSNGVIREMMSSAVTAEAAATSNDPSVMHPPGIYVVVSAHDGSTSMLLLEHTQAIGDKSSRNPTGQIAGSTLGAVIPGVGMLSQSGKIHTKQSLNGPKSPVQLDDSNPTFYLYIPEDTQSFGGSDLSARDFELIKLKQKDETREIEISAKSMGGMGVSGIQDKTRVVTTVSRLKVGIYMVKLAKPLKPGEYAFEHELDGVYYDFGIREAK